MKLEALYQELIIDHGTQPRNHTVLENANHTAESYNPLCGDKIKLYLKMNPNNGTIENASFQGQGCAISTASASLLTEMVVGKNLEEALSTFETFIAALTSNTCQEFPASLGKLVALSGVKEFPARVKCATLAWHTLESILKTYPITTKES